MRKALYYYTELGLPWPAADERFRLDPHAWLPAPGVPDEPGAWRVDLDVDGVLPGPLDRLRIEVVIEPPSEPNGHEATIRPVTFRAASGTALFPTFTGDLELAQLGTRSSHLSFVGSYKPPLNVIGEVGDRLFGRRAAEILVRRFVDAIADRLVRSTLPA